jgi:hypothetical protein
MVYPMRLRVRTPYAAAPLARHSRRDGAWPLGSHPGRWAPTQYSVAGGMQSLIVVAAHVLVMDDLLRLVRRLRERLAFAA